MSGFSHRISETAHPAIGYPNRRQGLLGSIDSVELRRPAVEAIDPDWQAKYLGKLLRLQEPELMDNIAQAKVQMMRLEGEE